VETVIQHGCPPVRPSILCPDQGRRPVRRDQAKLSLERLGVVAA
jgi:hypothetical protein